jgi:hypothetical protein
VSRPTPPSVRDELSDVRRAEVVAHYEKRLEAHGPTARGMDWKDTASQRLRFEVLCGVCDLRGLTVHEVGAGAGHLADYLRDEQIAADYSGSDRSAAMVAAARQSHPNVTFEQRDALDGGAAESWDVVLCSGLFHVKLGALDSEWKSFVEGTVRGMFDSCRVAVAFNLMSDRVDFRSEQLYYSSPLEMLDFCLREMSTNVVLRHDYPLYEYTMYVHRD